MSLCYDFEKWTMITCALILIVIAIGVIYMVLDVAYGQTVPFLSQKDAQHIIALKGLVDYCYAHASDSDNPIQDLVEKGLAPSEFNGMNCGTAKLKYDTIMNNIRERLNQSQQLQQEELKKQYSSFRECLEFSHMSRDDCAGLRK